MHSSTNINSYFGSVGWLIDRTGLSKQVLGSVWLVKSQVAITCTHALIPYFDFPEALGVEIPLTGKKFAVNEILVHSYFDPWLTKRHYQQSVIYPPNSLTVETNNLSALVLSANPGPVERSTVEKVMRNMKRAMPDEESALSGVATQLQITSIIQTLLSNRTQGALTLFDAANYPVAKFFLKENQLTHVRYSNFHNEDALYKLLTDVEPQTFQFTFTYDYEPEWTKFPAIEKNTAALLVDAYSRLESYNELIKEFPDLSIVIAQAVPNLNLDPLPLEIRPAVACTWNHLRHGMPLARLLKCCVFDGASILFAIKYLRETRQITASEVAPLNTVEPSKLSIGSNLSVERGTPLSCVSIDPDSRAPVVETGFVLDFFPAKGDGHFVHSLGLPESAAGSPLFANGELVGIHCGLLTEGVESYKEWIHPSLFISAEHVYHCLDLSPQKKTNEVLAFTPPNVQDRVTATQKLADDLATSSVHSTDYDEDPDEGRGGAGWTKTSIGEELAGQEAQRRRHEDRAFDQETPKEPPVDLSETGTHIAKKKTGFFESIGAMFKKDGLTNEAVEVSLLRQGLDSEKFEKVALTGSVRAGDTVRVRLRLLANTYAAVLLKNNSEEVVRLVYPESPAHEEQLQKGNSVDLPAHFTEASSIGRKKVWQGIPIKSGDGFDEVMVLTGPQPLVVRLFELGPDRVFTYVMNSLGQEQMGRFYVNRMDIKRAAPESQDSQNVLSVCVLQLRHSS